VAATLVTQGAICGDSGIETAVVPGIPEFASEVFVGRDSDMPLDGRYSIAIQPVRDAEGRVAVPKNVPDALVYLRRALPHWFLVAMSKAKGDRECDVVVEEGDRSHQEYWALIGSWYWIHWQMDDRNSPFRRRLSALGLDNDVQIDAALLFGLCRYVRTNDLKAGSEVVRFAK
jgi:hypothetical protein